MRTTPVVCLLVVLAMLMFEGDPGAQGGRGGGAAALFASADANKDAAVTRDELTAAFARWFAEWDAGKTGALSQQQLLAGLNSTIPIVQNQTPNPEHVQAMIAALPAKAAVQPKSPRRVLVLARAAGFVHSSIPLAARTIEEMGKKTGAWTATTTYDAADIDAQNLKQYDAIFLASTTGHFLDDPKDPAATAARRQALLEFVRNGKGLAGIHAASDSYHRTAGAPGGGGFSPHTALATQLLAQGDQNGDKQLSREEAGAVAAAWFAKMDTENAGRIRQQDLAARASLVMPPPAPRPSPAPTGATGFPIQGPATQLKPDTEEGTWPEFNRMLGGFFKFHWNDGQLIHVKVDDPDHPLNAPFKGKSQLQIVDETYTFGRNVYSRSNLRVLTSVDYDKMSAEDKAKEQHPRDDGDYALSWIRREGKGRVFYEAHGHNEKVYAIAPLLEHVMLGVQYVLGDLPADDSPSVKGGTK
jgi:type 1 glutamine amidotransferase